EIGATALPVREPRPRTQVEGLQVVVIPERHGLEPALAAAFAPGGRELIDVQRLLRLAPEGVRPEQFVGVAGRAEEVVIEEPQPSKGLDEILPLVDGPVLVQAGRLLAGQDAIQVDQIVPLHVGCVQGHEAGLGGEEQPDVASLVHREPVGVHAVGGRIISVHLPFLPHRVGPIAHGANSSSPTPLASLFVFLPLATARISSKICRPTSSTGVPARITPASTSMSSVMCRYSGVFVATLIDGTGLQPKTEPRPVVNTSTFAPPATIPVMLTGSYPG